MNVGIFSGIPLRPEAAFYSVLPFSPSKQLGSAPTGRKWDAFRGDSQRRVRCPCSCVARDGRCWRQGRIRCLETRQSGLPINTVHSPFVSNLSFPFRRGFPTACCFAARYPSLPFLTRSSTAADPGRLMVLMDDRLPVKSHMRSTQTGPMQSNAMCLIPLRERGNGTALARLRIWWNSCCGMSGVMRMADMAGGFGGETPT